MTVQLDWPPDVVNRLTEEARQKGLSLDAYVLEAIQKSGGNATSGNDADDLRKRRDAVASIRELREGNFLGSGLTIRDLVEEGRRF